MNLDLFSMLLSDFQYKTLKQNFEYIVENLNKSIIWLEQIETESMNNYLVDEVAFSSSDIDNVIETLRNRVKYINDTIIVAIDSKLKS